MMAACRSAPGTGSREAAAAGTGWAPSAMIMAASVSRAPSWAAQSRAAALCRPRPGVPRRPRSRRRPRARRPAPPHAATAAARVACSSRQQSHLAGRLGRGRGGGSAHPGRRPGASSSAWVASEAAMLASSCARDGGAAVILPSSALAAACSASRR